MMRAERIYRVLLKLYPAEFRREYGDWMAQAFRDQHRDAVRQRGLRALVRFWIFILAETVARALIEHWDAFRLTSSGGRVMYSKLHILLVFVPLAAITLYLYAAHDNRDMAVIYLLSLITGIAAWGLSRLRLIPANPIWNAYAAGILMGIGGIVLLFLGSLPAFGVYRLGLPPLSIPLMSITLYLLAIHAAGRRLGNLRWRYMLVGILLLATTTAGMFANTRNLSDDIAIFLSLSYALMQTLSALILTALCIGIGQRAGRLALVALMVALGVQFIWVDPGYFTGSAGQWIDLATLGFPLLICPAVWLGIRHKWRERGTLISWAALIGVVAIAPSLARVAMELDYEHPGVWLQRVLLALPYLMAVGLALQSRAIKDDESGMATMTPQQPAAISG